MIGWNLLQMCRLCQFFLIQTLKQPSIYRFDPSLQEVRDSFSSKIIFCLRTDFDIQHWVELARRSFYGKRLSGCLWDFFCRISIFLLIFSSYYCLKGV